MKVHEYQARDLLTLFKIPVCLGEGISSAAEAGAVFSHVANPRAVAKVQVLMGGRGKAGGVKLVHTAAEAKIFCEQFIGKPFSTTQSAGESKIVRKILIAESIAVRSEFYLGVVVDRPAGAPVVLFSKEGGVEIEEDAAK